MLLIGRLVNHGVKLRLWTLTSIMTVTWGGWNKSVKFDREVIVKALKQEKGVNGHFYSPLILGNPQGFQWRGTSWFPCCNLHKVLYLITNDYLVFHPENFSNHPHKVQCNCYQRNYFINVNCFTSKSHVTDFMMC